MKQHFLVTLLFCLLAGLVAAWDSVDHEIFRLRDEVVAHEGENVTFYDLLGIKPSASQDDIVKAYRKKSRTLHPDKARQSFIANYALQTPKGKPGQKKKKPGVHVRKQPSQKEIQAFTKQATERYARLRVVAEVLKGPGRERYDFFLKNGFPKWRGTGYYYARFRPGLGSVLFGLFVMGGGAAHYGAMYLSWKRQRDFVERYIRHARKMAWGDELGIQGIPGVDSGASAAASAAASGWETPPNDDPSVPMNRRQKRFQEKEARKKAAKAARNSGISTPVESELAPTPRGQKKRVVAENGKVLIVDSVGNVFLEEETEEGETQEYLLDVNEIRKPTFHDTVLFRLPKWCYRRTFGRVFGKRDEDKLGLDDAAIEPEGEAETAMLKGATAAKQNGEARKRRTKANDRPRN